MANEVEFIGLKKLLKKLETIEPKVAKKLFRRSLRDGAKVIQREAKRLVPKLSGDLRRGIRVKAGRRSRTSASVLVVSPTREKLGIPLGATGYYPATIEYVSPARGIPADPFFTDAFDNKEDEAMAVITQSLRAQIRAL